LAVLVVVLGLACQDLLVTARTRGLSMPDLHPQSQLSHEEMIQKARSLEVRSDTSDEPSSVVEIPSLKIDYSELGTPTDIFPPTTINDGFLVYGDMELSSDALVDGDLPLMTTSEETVPDGITHMMFVTGTTFYEPNDELLYNLPESPYLLTSFRPSGIPITREVKTMGRVETEPVMVSHHLNGRPVIERQPVIIMTRETEPGATDAQIEADAVATAARVNEIKFLVSEFLMAYADLREHGLDFGSNLEPRNLFLNTHALLENGLPAEKSESTRLQNPQCMIIHPSLAFEPERKVDAAASLVGLWSLLHNLLSLVRGSAILPLSIIVDRHDPMYEEYDLGFDLSRDGLGELIGNMVSSETTLIRNDGDLVEGDGDDTAETGSKFIVYDARFVSDFDPENDDVQEVFQMFDDAWKVFPIMLKGIVDSFYTKETISKGKVMIHDETGKEYLIEFTRQDGETELLVPKFMTAEELATTLREIAADPFKDRRVVE